MRAYALTFNYNKMISTRYLKFLIYLITLILSSCSYDYEYDIYDGNTVKRYTLTDNGFHQLILDTLNEYGASTMHQQRIQTVEEYDKDGNILYGGKFDMAQNCYISAHGASNIIVKVAMNAGEMGYICTEPFYLKPGGTNEIVLDENTPVYVELNVPEESLPTRYIITEDKDLDEVLLPIAQANGYDGYQASLYIHEYNANGIEIKCTNVKKAMLGELQMASVNSAYFIIEIALYKTNGIYFGAVDIDTIFNLIPHKLLKVNLDKTIVVKNSQYSNGSGLVIL